MGLGGSATGGMQKAYRQNRALSKKNKRTLKDIPTTGSSSIRGKALEYNKMSDGDYAEFKRKLEENRKKDKVKSIIIFFVSILITLFFLLK